MSMKTDVSQPPASEAEARYRHERMLGTIGHPSIYPDLVEDQGPPLQSTADDDEDVEYDKWTVRELKAELVNRGLSDDGHKADLVARLETDDEADEDGEE